MGVVDRDRVVYYRATVKRHTAVSEFDISTVTALPRVDVILVYQGAPGDLVKAAADNGAQGIVMATAGAGATSGTQGAAMREAAAKGVFIVTTTRTGSGRIAAPRAAAAPPTVTPPGAGAGPRRSQLFVAGEDLSPVKARILLMLALTKTREPSEIQRMFTEY
jgi:L-asparaginase